MPSPKEAALQMQLTNILMGCLGGAVVKNLLANAEDSGDGLDPWVGKIPWKRKWQPTPVSLPGKSCGQRSLVGYIQRITKSRTQPSLQTHWGGKWGGGKAMNRPTLKRVALSNPDSSMSLSMAELCCQVTTCTILKTDTQCTVNV